VRVVVPARGESNLDALDTDARNAIVTRSSFTSSSKRDATASASADSLAPQVRRTRLVITDVVPEAIWRPPSRQDCSFEHVGHLVGNAGHGVDDLLAHGTDQSGAVPRVWGMIVAPRGTSACKRLFSGIVRPREPNIGGSFRRSLRRAPEGHSSLRPTRRE